jgi:hypothetical protein
MKEKKSYILLFLIILSSVIATIIGIRWNSVYYGNDRIYSPSSPPLATAMVGLHDRVFEGDFKGQNASYEAESLSLSPDIPVSSDNLIAIAEGSDVDIFQDDLAIATLSNSEQQNEEVKLYDFTPVSEDYFDDACFIGDSRTVGISKYADIENATFLCETSLTIFDYERPKITYEGKKTSIRDVLTEKHFNKIYIMFGINECGSASAERFFEKYANTVNDIRLLQPGCIVFVEGSLLVTDKSSSESQTITNENISLRNYYLSLLENKHDIFYIDINESTLCEDGALVPEYTWDQVHIKAQYYPVWKEFLLEHGIVRT